MLPVEATRHAFVCVIAERGKSCKASGPQVVPTEGVGSVLIAIGMATTDIVEAIKGSRRS
jgi:hypothetical protein